MVKAKKLVALLKRPISPDVAKDKLYDLVGDDDLFDALQDAKDDRYTEDVRRMVALKLGEWDEWYFRAPEDWRRPFEIGVWETLRPVYRKILAPYRRG
jgi:hypothetical protein